MRLCPWCGARDLSIVQSGADGFGGLSGTVPTRVRYYVQCLLCGARGPEGATSAEMARVRWDMRGRNVPGPLGRLILSVLVGKPKGLLVAEVKALLPSRTAATPTHIRKALTARTMVVRVDFDKTADRVRLKTGA